MGAFELAYDPDDDVLEATFASFDERFARTLTLNDHIFVHTDLSGQSVWGMTFYSFSRLLGVSETEFTALRDLPEEHIPAILSLFDRPPASFFLKVTDSEGLIARVNAPGLGGLVEYARESP